MTKFIPVETIANKILFLRNEKVLLDRDLAEMYAVETKQLKRAVRRNISRFPKDFMFQLSNEEYRSLRRQFGTLKRGAHSKYPPMAFTEQGVAMLSSVLTSQRAIEVNIAIMRAFVHLRKMIASHKELAKKLTELEHHIKDHDEKIQAIFEAIQQLITMPEEESKKKIGFTAKEAQKSYATKPAKKKQSTRKSTKK
jgi:phage regulator Rha-like protein